MSGYLDVSQRIGNLLGPIKISGILALDNFRRHEIQRILSSHGGADRARRFVNFLDMSLWEMRRQCPWPLRDSTDLFRRKITRRSDEQRQLEKLERAALAIAEVLHQPAGDLRDRLGGWFDLVHLEQQILHLLHFANHTLAATKIGHGEGTVIPETMLDKWKATDDESKPVVDECRVLINVFRNHYPELPITPHETVFMRVASSVFGQDHMARSLEQLIARALRPPMTARP